jgi:hypothetical protein
MNLQESGLAWTGLMIRRGTSDMHFSLSVDLQVA